jgi:hypothetical protein
MVARGAFSGKRHNDQNAVGRDKSGYRIGGAKSAKGVSNGAPKGRRLFGAAGRAGSAHIVQLGAVGIERADEELAEEFTDSGEVARPFRAVGGRRGKRV